MLTTRGSLLHADDPPAAADGLVPGRLRAAGAILVGKTNLPEDAFEAYTANRLFGDTRNPWDLQRSPGGSSGGSAAALVGRHGADRDGDGRRRIGAHPRGVLRAGRAQAQQRDRRRDRRCRPGSTCRPTVRWGTPSTTSPCCSTSSRARSPATRAPCRDGRPRRSPPVSGCSLPPAPWTGARSIPTCSGRSTPRCAFSSTTSGSRSSSSNRAR